MNLDPQQEDAMGAKSKSGNIRGAARKRGRGAASGREAWERTAQIADERDDGIDCQRIVQGDSGRSLPAYYDDSN